MDEEDFKDKITNAKKQKELTSVANKEMQELEEQISHIDVERANALNAASGETKKTGGFDLAAKKAALAKKDQDQPEMVVDDCSVKLKNLTSDITEQEV